MRPSVRQALVITFTAAAWLGGGGWRAPSAATPTPARRLPADADHAYRVVGRARLLFFTVSDDDVGGARLTWTRRDDGESVRLLAGSEPARAPRDLNEWGYTSEDSSGDRSDTFAVRSMTPADLTDERPGKAAPRDIEGRFHAVCASAAGATVQTYSTTVKTEREITYHRLGNLLDRLVGAPQHWQPRDLPRPAGAAPGFLTAMGHLISASVDATAAGGPQPRAVPYVYNAGIYDLELRGVRRGQNVKVNGTTYPEVLKGDFAAVRRRDGDQTPFSVTYPARGNYAGVPVVIAFRVSWWLTVELQLDDRYDVPADPGGDAALSSRIREICAPVWTAARPGNTR